MKKGLNNEPTIVFKQHEWLLIKILFVLYWLGSVLGVLLTYNSAPVPHGVFTLFSITNQVLTWLNQVIIGVAVVLIIAYLFEFKMAITTLLLFTLSVFTFSLEESNGILSRSSLLSFLFFAQFIAYLLPGNSYQNNRILFSIQAIAATYTLSALSKLQVTGFSWVLNGKQMALQIIKSYQYKYATTGNWSAVTKGNEMADFIQNHPTLVLFMLTTTLLLELCALLCLRSKSSILAYGILLAVMHFFMALIMNINLSSISTPMFLFMVNPLYLLWLAYLKLTKKLKAAN